MKEKQSDDGLDYVRTIARAVEEIERITRKTVVWVEFAEGDFFWPSKIVFEESKPQSEVAANIVP